MPAYSRSGSAKQTVDLMGYRYYAGWADKLFGQVNESLDLNVRM